MHVKAPRLFLAQRFQRPYGSPERQGQLLYCIRSITVLLLPYYENRFILLVGLSKLSRLVASSW